MFLMEIIVRLRDNFINRLLFCLVIRIVDFFCFKYSCGINNVKWWLLVVDIYIIGVIDCRGFF